VSGNFEVIPRPYGRVISSRMASRRRLALVQDGIHLFGDGHFRSSSFPPSPSPRWWSVRPSATMPRISGDDFGQPSPFYPIPRRRCGLRERPSGTGEHQVTHAGPVPTTFRVWAPHADRQPRYLSEDRESSARASGVVAQGPCRRRLRPRLAITFFSAPAQLYSDHVVIGIDTQGLAVTEFALNQRRGVLKSLEATV